MASPTVSASGGPFQPLTNSEPGRRGHLKKLSLAQGGIKPIGGVSTPRHMTASPIHIYTPSEDGDGPERRVRTPHSASAAMESSRGGPPPSASSRASRSTGHARKQSSISYRSSPGPLSPIAQFSPTVSPLAARSRSHSGHGNAMDMMKTPSIPEEPVFDAAKMSPKPGEVMLSGATLVQQHGELLSFIAQKERRCLDLREELKKQEGDLKALKAKWEAIVAREVASNRGSPLMPPRASPALGVKRNTPFTSPELIHGSPGGPSRELTVEEEKTPTTSPDLSSPAPDISTSARRWMGGLVKSATASMDRMLENLAAPIEQLPPPPSTPLRSLPEEPEERPLVAPDSPSGSSISSSRRPMSGSSLTTDESAFFDESKTRSSSMSSLADLEETSSSSDTLKNRDVTPVPENKTPTLETEHSWYAQAEAAEAKVREEQKQMKHARRRSTFEALGQAASSFGSGLGKRWGDVTGSETFRNSKRVTLNLVDSFEKTLADALVIDNEPRSTPTSPRAEKTPSAPSTPQSLSTAWRNGSKTDVLVSLAEEEEEEEGEVTQQLSSRLAQQPKSPRMANRPRHVRKQSVEDRA